MRDRIRVLVVDDSSTARRIIADHLASVPGIEVVGQAVNGADALAAVALYRPDVVTLDLEMPVLDGVGFLRARPPGGPEVVVVSSHTGSTDPKIAEARAMGARHFVTKCTRCTAESLKRMMDQLAAQIQAAVQPSPTSAPAVQGLIAIGASTGGVEAIEAVLTLLPADSPPVLIVQHMPPKFTDAMAMRLDGACAMSVREACDGEPVLPGRVLIAPGDYHMQLVRSGGLRVVLSQHDKVNGHRPSVCVLFHSVARYGGPGVRGALLTGMGRDGAEGLLAMRQAGAFTVAQDKATSTVWGMPGAAVQLGAAVQVLPLLGIAAAISRPPARRAAQGAPAMAC